MSPELLLEWLGICDPPVDMQALTEALDIVVAHDDLGQYTSVLALNEWNAAVLLNVSSPPMLQRFAIARAIGHLVLHEGVEFRDVPPGSAVPSDEEAEAEADIYAARLLMPAAWLMPRLARSDTVMMLAVAFGVSESAIVARVRVVQPSRVVAAPTFD